ncbi:MAG: hypothetical protein OEY29_16180, partial [Gammaproteobacteria bacterium]|nr:hypothetical protein [Gammaproteobacteria bacterium]
ADTALDSFMGVGVTFAASDSMSVKAAYTSGQGTETSMAVRADLSADAMTAYGEYISNSASANGADIGVGGTYAMDAIGAYADYAMNDNASDLTVGATYTGEADAVSYSAMFEYAMDLTNSVNTYEYDVNGSYAVSEMISAGAGYTFRHDESTETTAHVTYTTEGGAVIALNYEVDTGTSADDGDDDYTFDAIVASASYSF